MKCCVKKCEKNIEPGLTGYGRTGHLEFIVPVCQGHWMVLGKLEAVK